MYLLFAVPLYHVTFLGEQLCNLQQGQKEDLVMKGGEHTRLLLFGCFTSSALYQPLYMTVCKKKGAPMHLLL